MSDLTTETWKTAGYIDLIDAFVKATSYNNYLSVPRTIERKLRSIACAVTRQATFYKSNYGDVFHEAVDAAEEYVDQLLLQPNTVCVTVVSAKISLLISTLTDPPRSPARSILRLFNHTLRLAAFSPTMLKNLMEVCHCNILFSSLVSVMNSKAVEHVFSTITRDILDNPYELVLPSCPTVRKAEHCLCWRHSIPYVKLGDKLWMCPHSKEYLRYKVITPEIVGLAKTAIEERGDHGFMSSDTLNMIADHIEEDGGFPAVVAHLRQPYHTKGCFVVDSIIHKE